MSDADLMAEVDCVLDIVGLVIEGDPSVIDNDDYLPPWGVIV